MHLINWKDVIDFSSNEQHSYHSEIYELPDQLKENLANATGPCVSGY